MKGISNALSIAIATVVTIVAIIISSTLSHQSLITHIEEAQEATRVEETPSASTSLSLNNLEMRLTELEEELAEFIEEMKAAEAKEVVEEGYPYSNQFELMPSDESSLLIWLMMLLGAMVEAETSDWMSPGDSVCEYEMLPDFSDYELDDMTGPHDWMSPGDIFDGDDGGEWSDMGWGETDDDYVSECW